MNNNLTQILDNQNWEEIILKLTAYALQLCRFWNVRPPNGLEAEDIVMDAIDKTYTGVRKWNPEIDGDLYSFLKSAIKSILHNNLVSADTKKRRSDLYSEDLPHQTDYDPDGEMYSKQIDVGISERLKDEPDLCLVYKALKDGYRPREIAEDYAIDIKIVRNAQKRLHRIALSVIDSLAKEYSNERI